MNFQPRHVLAREWRNRIGVSRAELAERIGYPARSIQEFEEGRQSGKSPTGEPKGAISDAHWLRYAMACAAYGKNLSLPF